jgi:DnaK suppressor protein
MEVGLEPDRIDFFRKLLADRRNAVLKEAGVQLGVLIEERETPPDAIDQASVESDREFSLRLQDRERRMLHKIEEAIARVETGSYGLCEACGVDIDERRLMARPVATHCIDCKTEQEQLESRRRAF